MKDKCIEYLFRYVIEVHSSGVSTSSNQGPNYTIIHRIEITQDPRATNIQVSIRIDYKKSVFQESKVDKRASDRIKKFYLDEINQIRKGMLKRKNKPKSVAETTSGLKDFLRMFISSLNADEVVLGLLIVTILFNILLIIQFVLRALG
eukprot:NODE_41_length_29768_cov_0.533924.p15 type:complete len:148 gc:universal NODE_41_length_29768_cov_0.533924:5953-6396(+)